MNHIKNIIKSPTFKKIIYSGAKGGAVGGGIFGTLYGVKKADYNIKHIRYLRPSYINPYVYLCGNFILYPVIGGATGMISGAMIGATIPISLPWILYYNHKHQ